MRKAIRTNMATRGGIPLFENDEVVISALSETASPAEAVSGADWAVSIRVFLHGRNIMAQKALRQSTLPESYILPYTMVLMSTGKQVGRKTGDPRNFKTFDELYQAFLEQYQHICHKVLWLGGVARVVQPNYLRYRCFHLSGIEASMDLGQDLLFPHPDYSMYGISDRQLLMWLIL